MAGMAVCLRDPASGGPDCSTALMAPTPTDTVIPPCWEGAAETGWTHSCNSKISQFIICHWQSIKILTKIYNLGLDYMVLLSIHIERMHQCAYLHIVSTCHIHWGWTFSSQFLLPHHWQRAKFWIDKENSNPRSTPRCFQKLSDKKYRTVDKTPGFIQTYLNTFPRYMKANRL